MQIPLDILLFQPSKSQRFLLPFSQPQEALLELQADALQALLPFPRVHSVQPSTFRLLQYLPPIDSPSCPSRLWHSIAQTGTTGKHLQARVISSLDLLEHVCKVSYSDCKVCNLS